jgi:O-antigen/teichoic acid export membrane protein
MVMVFRTIYERIINLGTESSLIKSYFEVDSKNERKSIISSAFFFLLIISITTTAILWFFRANISSFLLSVPKFSYLFSFALGASFFFTVKTIPLSVFRAQERSFLYSTFAFLTLTLGIVLNIVFVVLLRKNIEGILKSAMITQGVVFAIILIPFSKNLIFSLKKKYLHRMLTFGIPLVPSSLAIWILTLMDRYFLKIFCSLDEVGIYSLGYRIGTIMSMLVIVPFSLAWGPLMLKWFKEKNARSMYAKVFKYFSILGFWAVLGLSLYSKEVLRIMTTPAFYDAYKIVFFISGAYLLHGFYMIFTAGCTLYRKTLYLSIATGGAALVNTVLNILLIPRYTMVGAAFATISSYLVMTVMMYIFSERYYHIPFNFRITMKIAFVTLVLYVIGFHIGEGFLYGILIKLLLIALYFPCLYVLRVFTEREMNAIKSWIRKGEAK